MLLDQRGHNSAVGSQSLNGGSLIFCHEATVTCHIRTENSGQLTFEVLWAQ